MRLRDQIPSDLIRGVATFNQRMGSFDEALWVAGTPDESAAVAVGQAVDALFADCSRAVRSNAALEVAIGKYVFRETFAYLMRSAFIERSLMKPCGYAGDFLTIEWMYENRPSGDGPLGSSSIDGH